MSGPRLGLALGSGSARGWAHIGVLQALARHGLEPDVITGASVGALVGAARAAGRLADLEQWVCKLTQRDVWRLVDTTFRGGGVMTGSRLMEAIAAQIGDAPIESLPVTFGAVATDLYTGEEVWLRDGPYMTAVRASSGVPGLFAPTWHQDRWLIDGGVVNPVPVSLCRALGADIVIAVDMSRSVTKVAKRASDQDVPQIEPDGSRHGRGLRNAEEVVRPGGWPRRVVPQQAPGTRPARGDERRRRPSCRIASRAAGSRSIRPTSCCAPTSADFQLMDFHRAREAIDIGAAQVEQSAVQLAQLATDLRLRRPG